MTDFADILRDPPRLRLRLRVQPRASRSRVAGVHGDALKVQIAAAPVDGAANVALIDLVAELLDVRRADVQVAAGKHGRSKVVEVASTDPAGLLARLRERLEPGAAGQGFDKTPR